MDQRVVSARSQIEQFKKDKYHFDPETGRCLLPDDAKSDYDNALKILSEQLYTKDIHFIFELIQNAEDNHYSPDVIPTLSFELLSYDPTNTSGCKGCLVIRNNEVGFELSNIKAISSIGKSTKANQKDAGYIGEKGIGFKSVFVVSPAPHIISNGFQIKFLKEDPKTGLGYIVPYWLDNAFGDYSAEAGTTLLLPLQNKQTNQDSMFDKVQHELGKLSAEIVLFLRKLKKLTIKTPNYYADYELRKSGDEVELFVRSASGEAKSKYLLKSKTVEVPDRARNNLRENVVKRDVSLAFPIDFKLEASPLYCYLPTEFETGLPFVVNADFILNASREAIRQDLAWNSWMREEVATFAASTLADILSSKGDLSRWAWVPQYSNSAHIKDYWGIVSDQIVDKLKETACIPALSGDYLVPADVLLLGQSFRFLKGWPNTILGRLTRQLAYDELGDISKISAKIGLQRFEKKHFIELIQALRTDDALTDEQLIDVFVELTSVNERSYSRGSMPYKYKDKAGVLKSCAIFKCHSGLQSTKYKNLYLPSDENHEVPILENDKGESTKPNYIDRDFYLQIPEPVKSGIRFLFDIEEVNPVSYLEQSVYIFLKENTTRCLSESLEVMSKYLISNIDELPDNTIELLREVLPFKNKAGVWVFPKKLSRYVAPSSLFEKPNWAYIYQSKEELQHICELSEDYLTLGDELNVQTFLDEFNIDEFVRPFVITQEKGPPITARPIVFTTDNYWQSDSNRYEVLRWLNWVYDDEDKITSNENSEIELGYFLLNHRWLLSTNEGFVKPSPSLHCFSEAERSIFGNSLNYLKDNVTKVFAKKLGLVTEPTPKGFMDQIKAAKDTGSVDKALLISAYESLSNWKDPSETERIKRRLAQDQLVYLPEIRDGWLSPAQATWEDKSDLGSSFIGLSSYIPERLKYYFVETLGVKPHHGIASYIAAYKELSNSNEKLSNKKQHSLNTIVRHLSQFIRTEDFYADNTWNSFKSQCKIYSDQGIWVGTDQALFVADDGKTKELFADHASVYFTWSNATEFYSFFEEIGVRKTSEYVDVQIGRVTKGREVDAPQIAIPAKKAICYYIADNFSVDDQLAAKLATFFHSRELNCQQLTVKYSLATRYYVEVTTELGFYDAQEGSLILVDNNELAEIKDELALSIARVFFGKKASQHEKFIRVFIDIESDTRLANVLKKEGLELDVEKEERLENIFALPESTNDLVGKEVATVDVEQLIESEEDEVVAEEVDEFDVDSDNGNDAIFTQQEPTENIVDSSESHNEDYDEPSADIDNAVVEIAGQSSESTQDENVGPDSELTRKHSSESINNPVRNDDIGSHSENERAGLNAESKDDIVAAPHEVSPPISSLSGSNDSEARKRPILSLKKKRELDDQFKTDARNIGNKVAKNTRKQKSPNKSQSAGYRLFSYVESEQTHERSEKSERDDAIFGNKAELYVKQWLNEQGFNDIELLGGVNKGFDIQAVDPDTGELVFVEVKGQRGAWNRTGVALSKSQMEKCLQEGDSYWLIVVEHLLSEPLVHKFVNPARLIDRYYFDANWAKVSDLLHTPEPKEINLDDLFFDEDTKSLYQQIKQSRLVLPEIGFEISNDQFEVIAELEFAWPELKIGVFLEEPEEEIDHWTLFSIEDVMSDISILIKKMTLDRES